MKNNNVSESNKHHHITQAMLEAYNAATVQYEEVGDITAVDLILDLLQYCEYRGWDPRTIYAEALEYYYAEKYDQIHRQKHS